MLVFAKLLGCLRSVFIHIKNIFLLRQDDILLNGQRFGRDGDRVTSNTSSDRCSGLFDLKKWNRMKDSLMLCPSIGLEIGCLHLKSTGLKVAFMEDWARIVHAAHCPLAHDNHLGEASTLKAVQKEW
ncbi:hypothetical protein GOP47_0021271 [Adiantum capillus-veneris]|uniref:Uncharacterized protein n=1 Tax=Adiantum capillus-veneris TaxID=13818 RepID=A0A9D4Z9H7_ADICA|nr:hypothetical protein GOP47_0021271 [Adiantum capillus-veneris]